MIGQIYHVGLTVSDLDRSVAFYRDVLGLQYQGELLMEGKETEAMFRRENCKARVAYLNGSDQLHMLLNRTSHDHITGSALHLVEDLMKYLRNNPVHDMHRISGLSGTLLTTPCLIVAHIANALFVNRCSIRSTDRFPVRGKYQAASAVSTKDISGEQGLSCRIQRHCSMLFSLIGSLQHQLLCQIKVVRGNDLKLIKGTSIGFAASKDSFIKWVM